MTTEEGNKLVAEFMGAVKSKVDNDTRYLRFKEPIGTTYAFYNHELKYHASWDWLMPVVEKIEGLGFRFKQCRRRVEIETDFPVGIRTPIDARITIQKHETKILSAWYAITQFITWYNQNQKS